MLVLKRKANQSIIISDDIRVVVLSTSQNFTTLGIEAPDDVVILRNEVKERIELESAYYISGLMSHATAAANIRGHVIRWQDTKALANLNTTRYGSCISPGCSAWVQVLTKPKPNEIEIGGPAIALACPVAEEDCC